MRGLTDATSVLCNLHNILFSPSGPVQAQVYLQLSKRKTDYPRTDTTRENRRDITGWDYHGLSSNIYSIWRWLPETEIEVWYDFMNERTFKTDLTTWFRSKSRWIDLVSTKDVRAWCFEELNATLMDRTWLIVFYNFDTPNSSRHLKAHFLNKGNRSILNTSRHIGARSLGHVIDVPWHKRRWSSSTVTLLNKIR